jgi:hypothetical protein
MTRNSYIHKTGEGALLGGQGRASRVDGPAPLAPTSMLATWNRCSWREKVWIVVLGALILEGLFVVMAI